jgi:uncharacterized protein (DUF302 family)
MSPAGPPEGCKAFPAVALPNTRVLWVLIHLHAIDYPTTTMKTILTSSKSVDQAASDFEDAVSRNGFGILHVYNLKETLEGKGFPQAEEIRVYEICNPGQANRVLGVDLEMNMALPCRVSIYSQDGHTKVGMINPSMMLEMLSDDEQLTPIAEEVESTIVQIMNETI